MKGDDLELVFKEGGAILLDPKRNKVLIYFLTREPLKIDFISFKRNLKRIIEELDDPSHD